MSDALRSVVAVILVALLVWGAMLLLSETTNPSWEARDLAADTRPLGDYLDFPTGYELADTYAYAHNLVPYVVYICRHIETGEYRTCNPVVREVGK